MHNTLRGNFMGWLIGSLVGSLLALFSLSGMAATGAWEPVKQAEGRDDISTWVRSVDGMAVKAFRGQTEINQSALTLLALMADIPNLSNWIFKCYSAQQPASYSPDHTYAKFKGVWPASPRDVLFKTVVTQQTDGSILLESRQVEGYPVTDDHVRMPYLNNTFRFTPLKGGWTKVEFETQVDLGGMVPTWLANLVSTKAALETLEGMHKEVLKPKYKIKSVNELPSFYLKGKPLVLPADH